MIKVGQVYKNDDFRFIVTHILPRRNQDGFIGKRYQVICDDGFVFEELKEDEITSDKLIAQYPTWQAAVNSKEFKGSL